MAGAYEVKLVTNRTSFTKVVLDNAVPENPYREINGVGKFAFRIPTFDTQAALVCDNIWGRGGSYEIQLWRDNKCIWWGVPVTADLESDPEWTKVDCRTFEWVLSTLFFGPIQNNYASNGDFEQGLVGWTTVGGTSSSVSGGWRARGTKCARLVTASAGQESYLSQFVNVTAPANQGRVFWVSATYRVDPSVTWSGPPIYERGLYLARLVNGVVQGDDYVWDPITEDTQHDGSEVHAESPFVTVPQGQTQTLEIRLYGPGGAIEWDDVRLVVEESVSTAPWGEDVSTYIGRIVAYAQDGDRGKFPLNIGFASTPTGRLLPLTAEQFYDDGNVWQAILRYVEQGWCDVGVVWNDSGTQRTFTVWPGQRGSHKAGLLMDLDIDGRVKSFGYLRDSTQAATKVRVRGEGTGATREVAEVTDTSSAGGVVIERVITPPHESTAGALVWFAQAEIDRAKRAVDVPKFTTHENQGDVIDDIDLGDTVPVLWDFGWVQESGTRRIVAFSINVEDDSLEPTVN